MNSASLFMAVLVAATFVALPSLPAGDFSEQRDKNWHHWRGPLASGVAPLGDPPLHWDENTNIRWKTAIPGEGSSTPIIWGDRLFLLSAVETDRLAAQRPKPNPDAKTLPPANIYEFVVVCLDRPSGKVLWQKTVCEDVPHEGRHPTNTYASGSPMTDGERLYASFGSRGLYCLTLDGKLLWQRDFGDMRTRYGWGEAATPVVHDGSVIVNWDHEDQSFITVLDAKTGKPQWQNDRDEPSSWATPVVTTHDGRTQVIVNGTNRVRSYDLSTGDVIWECGGQTVNAIPSPVLADGFVVCMSGYRGAAAYAIPLNATGDITGKNQELWRIGDSTPYVPSPVLTGNRLYFTKLNSGILTCLDVNTGKRLFGPQRLPTVDNVYASPVAAAGRIYFVGRGGQTLVIADADKFEVLATNSLDEPMDASPAVVGDELFLRGANHMYCIGKN